jgi:hypothetical protein
MIDAPAWQRDERHADAGQPSCLPGGRPRLVGFTEPPSPDRAPERASTPSSAPSRRADRLAARAATGDNWSFAVGSAEVTAPTIEAAPLPSLDFPLRDAICDVRNVRWKQGS